MCFSLKCMNNSAMSCPSHILHFATTETTCLGQIRASATMSNTKGLPRRPLRAFGSHAIVIVLEGIGFYEDELGRKSDISAGDAVWVLPRLGQSYGAAPGTLWDEFFVEFSGPVYDQMGDLAFSDLQTPVFREVPAALKAAFLEFAHRPPAFSPTGRLAEAGDWLALLARLVATSVDNTSFSWEDHAKARIDSLLASPDVIQRVAKELHLSSESFRRRFTQRCGISPVRYAAERRLDEASRLVSQTQLPLSAIASALGFCDAFHLSRQYRIKFGVPPSLHRTQGGALSSRCD